MKNSCGAILYTFDPNGDLGIILGTEGSDEWLPFKGCNEDGETFEQTAIREIREETCNLVHLESINLDHVFTTKHKIYRIGLCPVDYGILEQFKKARVSEVRKEFREKQELKFFKLSEIFRQPTVHSITRASIKYYWDKLACLSGKKLSENSGDNARCHGMTEDQAKMLHDQAMSNLVDTYPYTSHVDYDNYDKYATYTSGTSDLYPKEVDGIDKASNVNTTNNLNTLNTTNAINNVEQSIKVTSLNLSSSSSDDSDDSPKYKTPRKRPVVVSTTVQKTIKKRHANLSTLDTTSMTSNTSTSRATNLYSITRANPQTMSPNSPNVPSIRRSAKREYNLPRAKKIGLRHSPAADRISEECRVWRVVE